MTFHLLHLQGIPIFEQLQIEEALLRLDNRNFCIINEGSSPAIVMGISGKLDELIHHEKWQSSPIPIIKRFSGGGTVIVDEETLFVSFLCQKELHPFPSYPEPIMRWTEALYQDSLKIPDFHLRENDYVIGHRKCGGNAQYLRKERWLHHSTFLWDFRKENMDYLKHPKKTPPYREGRSHLDFLCKLGEHLPSKAEAILSIKSSLAKRYVVKEISLEDLKSLLKEPHRQTTELVLC